MPDGKAYFQPRSHATGFVEMPASCLVKPRELIPPIVDSIHSKADFERALYGQLPEPLTCPSHGLAWLFPNLFAASLQLVNTQGPVLLQPRCIRRLNHSPIRWQGQGLPTSGCSNEAVLMRCLHITNFYHSEQGNLTKTLANLPNPALPIAAEESQRPCRRVPTEHHPLQINNHNHRFAHTQGLVIKLLAGRVECHHSRHQHRHSVQLFSQVLRYKK